MKGRGTDEVDVEREEEMHDRYLALEDVGFYEGQQAWRPSKAEGGCKRRANEGGE